ncbi:SLC13 family permease [Desulfurivibrio sp. C05AmB]|uniref:SLC13 family permease n=1 Tax=Desulfurivibrio sp. C05AmB TaxID=3374371 RepID=UPI00376F03FB
MNTEQLIVFGVLGATLALFIWGRWRYDIVALIALLAMVISGLVPSERAFAGFGHPAVVTVAAVLVLSRGLLNAGVVDSIARYMGRVGVNPTMQVAALTGLVALCSAFMNNVGALALLMPVAIWMSRQAGRSPSLLLMPLAFGSLLGGTVTLIGTPPNIIIAAYRAETGVQPFGMFDFLPVGAGITIAGLIFITLVGWRLTPRRQENSVSKDELFKISDYIIEVRVPAESKFAGGTLHDLQVAAAADDVEMIVIGLVRGKKRQQIPSSYEVLRQDDILLIKADTESLERIIDLAGLELASKVNEDEHREKVAEGEINIIEAVVAPESLLIGKTAIGLSLRDRYGINVLAVARQGQRLRERLGRIPFVVGDILLIQGQEETLAGALAELGCLPLAEREMRVGKPRRILLATGIFGAAIAAAALNLLPAATALVCGAIVMVMAGLLSSTEAYKNIEWSIIVLLAAMIPIGQALETSGGAQLIADGLLGAAGSVSPALTIAILTTATMLLSNVINNAAAAILVAPIALSLARGMEASADPFLMAVAIGASCAFLTPIGHQSNTLVMAPGGYRFSDYWKMGLPLSLMVVATAVPLIMWFWPL